MKEKRRKKNHDQYIIYTYSRGADVTIILFVDFFFSFNSLNSFFEPTTKQNVLAIQRPLLFHDCIYDETLGSTMSL